MTLKAWKWDYLCIVDIVSYQGFCRLLDAVED